MFFQLASNVAISIDRIEVIDMKPPHSISFFVISPFVHIYLNMNRNNPSGLKIYLLLEYSFYFDLEDIKSRFLVNGQENEPRMEYDAIETPTQINGIGDEPVEDSSKQGM